MPLNLVGSYWVPGWWNASPDQASDEGAEQSFAAATGVMHELDEPAIQRQIVLRGGAGRAQRRARQRPEALNGVDVNRAEHIAIFVTRSRAVSVAYRFA